MVVVVLGTVTCPGRVVESLSVVEVRNAVTDGDAVVEVDEVVAVDEVVVEEIRGVLVEVVVVSTTFDGQPRVGAGMMSSP